MVVQRDMPVHVWGWTKPNTDVHVEMAGHEADTKSDKTGRFDVKLDPLPAGGPHELIIKADETKTFKDVLVGEVWICSGQSNMQWPVGNANDPDLETLTANYPNIRSDFGTASGRSGTSEQLRRKMGSLLSSHGEELFCRWLLLRSATPPNTRCSDRLDR